MHRGLVSGVQSRVSLLLSHSIRGSSRYANGLMGERMMVNEYRLICEPERKGSYV